MSQKILVIRHTAIKIKYFLKFVVLSCYEHLIKPVQADEEIHRKELICNLLLIFILCLMFGLDILVLISCIANPHDYSGINPLIMLCITGSFICLLYISRKGYINLASNFLISVLIVSCVFGQLKWGADLPSVILLWCFIITASSILISTRFAFFFAITISFETVLFQILEREHLIRPLKMWKNTAFQIDDAIEYALIFTLIAGVSWISNREIFKSLLKVRQSKLALQKEKDSLEIKVIERTKELHQAQVDKINSMYQLVEFGRISSGLFHDLITPLNTLGIAIQNIGNKNNNLDNTHNRNNTNHISTNLNHTHSNIDQVQKHLDICLRTSNRIVDFINLAKRQIQQNEDVIKFEINNEIQNTITLLTSKARHNNVQLIHKGQKKLYIQGNPTLFSHILTNLISNAIDAYQNMHKDRTEQLVLIYTQRKHKMIEIKIRDFGSGIPLDIQPKIFEPFFTTKSNTGCGIGLSATKHTLEKYFNGTISFISKSEHIQLDTKHTEQRHSSKLIPSTTFTIKIPSYKYDKTCLQSNNSTNTQVDDSTVYQT